MSAHLWEEPKQMLEIDDVALWYALNQLMTNYWADVDHNGGSRAHEFYLPGALFAVGNNRFEGPEKIRAFYARRRKHGTTTTRHLVGNLRVLRDDECCVWSLGVMSLYRADGRPPLSVGKTARHDRGFRSPMFPHATRTGSRDNQPPPPIGAPLRARPASRPHRSDRCAGKRLASAATRAGPYPSPAPRRCRLR